ncbi:MAG: hypothetical protein KA765_01035 [Thermoflexales bacterium]|nr:hypothetical protein [Thermoflexales bacterium]
MEDTDKLMGIVQRMSPSQLRQLTRFAEFLMLEDEPDDLRDRTDVRTRYTNFKDLCSTWNVDLGAVESWAKETSKPRTEQK